MSEDYKKIALEDVKKGQRIRIDLHHYTHVASYTGRVVNIDSNWKVIVLGDDFEEFHVYINDSEMPDIFLLEDAPQPKAVRTETVTITHYDDGTKTETPVKEVKAPMVIETMDQFEEHEEYLKKTLLHDKDGDPWMHLYGSWNTKRAYGEMWLDQPYNVIELCLPLTVVETPGD